MFLRKRPRPSGTEDDLQRVREALGLMLTHLASSVPVSQRDRATTLAQRVADGTIPTGLTREVRELVRSVRPSEDGDDTADVSRAMFALAEALNAAAMDDRELRIGIHHFIEWLPKRINAAHARGVTRRVGAITESAPAAWDRIARAQAATALLVKSLVASIAKASGGPGDMSENLDALAVTVVQLKDVDGMADLARRMESQVDGLRLQVTLMQRELDTAQRLVTQVRADVDPSAEDSGHEARMRARLK